MVISFSFFLVFSLSSSYVLFDFNFLIQDKLHYPCLYCILDLFLINEVVSHSLALVYHTGSVGSLPQANNFKILCSAALDIPSQQDLGQLCMAAWHGQPTAMSLLPIHCQVVAGQLHMANSVRQLFMGDQRESQASKWVGEGFPFSHTLPPQPRTRD